MLEREIIVKTTVEPSVLALLVQKASEFECQISLVLEEKTANAKSIMGLISLGLKEGQTLKIVANGADAAKAIDAFDGLL